MQRVLLCLRGLPDVSDVEISAEGLWRPDGSGGEWLDIASDPAGVAASLAASRGAPGAAAVKPEPGLAEAALGGGGAAEAAGGAAAAQELVVHDSEGESEEEDEMEELRKAAAAVRRASSAALDALAGQVGSGWRGR